MGEDGKEIATVVFLDGISAPIPLLRIFGLKVIFYCHFPDMVISSVSGKNIFMNTVCVYMYA
jgi:hypothetical protein